MPLARLTQLARVTAELVGATDEQTVTRIVTRHAGKALGAPGALLAIREGARARIVGRRGPMITGVLEGDTFSVDVHHPLAEVLRTGVPAILIGGDAVAERYPELASGLDRSLVALPLAVADSAPIGALGFRFEGEDHRPDEVDLQLLEVLRMACTSALVRIAAEHESRERANKLQFLADASEALAGSLDYRQTLGTVVQLAVPDFADWCTVQLLEDGRLKTLAVAHTDAKRAAQVWELAERYPISPDSPRGAYQVVRTGRTEYVAEFTAGSLSAAEGGQRRMATLLDLQSVIAVPLTSRGKVLGVLTFISSTPGLRYTPEDVTLAEDLGRRAAIAIDNSDLFSQTRHTVSELQLALLPMSLPVTPGWDFGVTYRQSGRTDFGGDFYDLAPLPDGRLMAVIGDVMGRGVDAAAAAVRMRSAVRAYAAQDADPTSVALSLDRLMGLDEVSPLVTMAYLVFDGGTDVAEIFIAGHLPPLVLAEDGSCRFVTEGGSPAFGVGPMARPGHRVTINRGDTVLLYTDGLVERRDEDIETSLARLRRVAGAGSRADLTGWLDRLADRLPDPQRNDDVAALALRRHP